MRNAREDESSTWGRSGRQRRRLHPGWELRLYGKGIRQARRHNVEWFELGALAAALGSVVTAHVALLWGFLFGASRQPLLMSLLIPPLAPYFGWRAQRHAAARVWVAGLLVYLLLGVLRGHYFR